ncbi:MAG: hypothetical protein ACR2ML_10265 [Solirubrobacteraceae bacterium]
MEAGSAAARRTNWDSPVVVEGQASGVLAGLGQTLTRGVVAGLFAGLLFLLSQMGWAVENLDKPAVAPMLDMSTVFTRDEVPAATPINVVIGLVTHLNLSMLFGIGFAILVAPLARSRVLKSTLLLVLGGLSYGLLLYVVDIQILGRTLFEWFTNPNGPPQIAEIFFHAEFGLLLVPFFIGAAQRVKAARA